MSVLPTVHCDWSGCTHWAPYDPNEQGDLPDGWVEVSRNDSTREFCGRAHAVLALIDGLGALPDVHLVHVDGDQVYMLPAVCFLDRRSTEPLRDANVAYNRSTRELVKARW